MLLWHCSWNIFSFKCSLVCLSDESNCLETMQNSSRHLNFSFCVEIPWKEARVIKYSRSQLVKAQLTGAVFLEDDHCGETFQKRWEDINALFPLSWEEMQDKRLEPFQGNACNVCPLDIHWMTFLHKVEKDPVPLSEGALRKLLTKCWNPSPYHQRLNRSLIISPTCTVWKGEPQKRVTTKDPLSSEFLGVEWAVG